jgi:hypothetical protein
MSSQATNDDLAGGHDVDWLESQFFSQARLSQHDLDWGPVAPAPVGMRRAMHAAIAMLAMAIVGFIVLVMYSNLIMPVPEPTGASETLLPPSAANPAPPPSNIAPNG